MNQVARLDFPYENDSIKANSYAIQIRMSSCSDASCNVDNFEHFTGVQSTVLVCLAKSETHIAATGH
jgi:hypothetical protein